MKEAQIDRIEIDGVFTDYIPFIEGTNIIGAISLVYLEPKNVIVLLQSYLKSCFDKHFRLDGEKIRFVSRGRLSKAYFSNEGSKQVVLNMPNIWTLKYNGCTHKIDYITIKVGKGTTESSKNSTYVTIQLVGGSHGFLQVYWSRKLLVY